jgi:hypothetical protein
MTRLLNNVYNVILNEVQDLDQFEKNRFFSTLRIPNMGFPEFFYSFQDAQLRPMLSLLLPNGDIPCWTGMLMKF